MPVYDHRDPAKAPPAGHPFHVVDGKGDHVPFCVTADTDTGEVTRYQATPDGSQPAIGPDLRPTVVTETRPLPFTFEAVPSPWSPRATAKAGTAPPSPGPGRSSAAESPPPSRPFAAPAHPATGAP